MVDDLSVPEPHDSQSGLVSSYEWNVITYSTGLVLLNIALMYALVLTPLATVNALVFSVPIIGVLVYGALLTGGEWYAERSLKSDNMPGALLGVGVLQLTYAAFGSGVLFVLPREYHLPALGITAVATAGMTAVLSGYIYLRGADCDQWVVYSMGLFLGGMLFAGVGSFAPSVLVVAFLMFFLGFFFRLGWEIWQVREQHHDSPKVAALGVYVSVTGVFVHILQMVVRMFLSHE